MSLNTEHKDNRALQSKKHRNNTAEPPRTRPGANFPGGKHLRRAHAKLAVRRKNHDAKLGKMPGSMKG